VESLPAGSALDSSGQLVQVGDRITWSVAASCGCCQRCENQFPQKCESLFKYGHELCSDGKELSGGLAQYCVLQPGTAVLRIPEGLPDAVAWPANCATATVAAALRQAGDLNGKRVLVLGAGMLGLTACAMTRTVGAATVCLCEPNQQRRQRAVDFGATEITSTVTSDDFDCVLEMSGTASAVEAAVQAAAIGGRIILVGSVSPGRPVAIDPERIVRRLLSIHGVHNYRPDDLTTAVGFLEDHHQRYPFAELVERSWPLSEVNIAFEFAMKQRPVRVAVIPD